MSPGDLDTAKPYSRPMASDPRTQRVLLFEKGGEAFEVIGELSGVFDDHPETRGWYVCPLCLHAFPKTALDADPPDLTIDETPPKASSRGPITKVLTCRQCNNRAGRQLEGELKKRRNAEDFARGALSSETRIRIEVGDGSQTRASATHDPDGLRVVGAPQASPPDAVASSTAWWDAQVGQEIQGSRFTIHLEPFHIHRSNVALLKAAYLAAFAAFGYRFVWRPEMDPVRAEIADPGAHLSMIPILTSPELEIESHRLMVARSPLTALGVQIGQQVAFLPWMDSPPQFWDRMAEGIVEGAANVTFDSSGDWPRFPEYRLDRAPPDSSEV